MVMLYSFFHLLLAVLPEGAYLSTPEQLVEEPPSSLIEGLVSPLSGQIVLGEVDLIARGAQDVLLQRVFKPPTNAGQFSPNAPEDIYNLYRLAQSRSIGWQLLPHLYLRRAKEPGKIVFTMEDGRSFQFKETKKGFTLDENSQGFSNYAGGEVAGKYDLRNTRLQGNGSDHTVYCPDGTKYLFHNFQLQKQLLPNGKVIKYSWKENTLKEIVSLDPLERYIYASIQCDYNTIIKDLYHHSFESSCGKVDYEWNYYTWSGSFRTKEGKITATFRSPALLRSVERKGYPVETMHYTERLTIASMSGARKNFVVDYRPNCISLHLPSDEGVALTEVYQIDSTPFKAGIRETTVLGCDGRKTVYLFNENSLPLSIKQFEEEKLFSEKQFRWSANGWLEREELYDEGKRVSTRNFSYDEYGNPIREEVNGLVIERTFDKHLLRSEKVGRKSTYYSYLGETNLLTDKRIYEGEKLHTRETWEYDDCNNLVVYHLEDGPASRYTRYTLRQEAPLLHMPEWVEEGCEEITLHKKQLFYDEKANIVKEDQYDANGQFAFSIQRTFNERGDLLTETDPRGALTINAYDERGNRISQSKGSNQLVTKTLYDLRDRPIFQSASDRETKWSYDAFDRLLSKAINGQKTLYSYLPGRRKPSTITLPTAAVTKYRYDAQDLLIESIDPNGNSTKYQYNPRGDLETILFADGSVEKREYSPEGYLLKRIDPEGITTEYERDAFGRIIKESCGERSSSFIYDGSYLIESIDPALAKTHFAYDSAGRKIAEFQEGREVRFTYDPLGRIASESCGGVTTLFTYDLSGNLVSRAVPGQLLVEYAYDLDNQLSEETRYHEGKACRRSFLRDLFGRIIEERDPLGFISYHRFDDWLLQKSNINPNGIETLESFDFEGRLLKKEVIERGRTLFSEKRAYDPAGNLLKAGPVKRSYNKRNQIASETYLGRTTRFDYTSALRLKEKKLPSEISLFYEYDDQGNLASLRSSDGKINHHFKRDQKGRITEAKDLAENISISRTYDMRGNLIKETFPSGSVEKKYDQLSRPTEISWDSEGVKLSYESLYLTSISPLHGREKHSFTYDLAGNIISEELPFNLCTITHHYDSCGREILRSSGYFTDSAEYDPAGNRILTGKTPCRYDGLSQLVQEGREHYQYDSEQNRLPLPTSFDLQGNVINLRGKKLTFDALNRLTRVDDEIQYTYDPFGRRIAKTVKGVTEHFLYDGTLEVGVKNPFSFKLNNRTCIPFYDIQGSVRRLVDSTSKWISHTYDQTAFGVQTSAKEASFCPFRLFGKRLDPETGLIYFGKRYYDPQSGRWLSQDPVGPLDGTNLYQFCHNNPLRYFDPNGEFAFVVPVVIELFTITFETLAIEWITFETVAAAVAAAAAINYASYQFDKLNSSYDYLDPYDSRFYKNKEGDDDNSHPYPGQQNWGDFSNCPVEGFEWRGGKNGSWHNPETLDSLRPAPDGHGGTHEPHWDYSNQGSGRRAEIKTDGSIKWKP